MKNSHWVVDFQTLSCSKFDEEFVWIFFMMRHDSCGLVCPFFGRVSCSKTVARWHWGHGCQLRRHIHRRGQPGPCACSADTIKGATKRCYVWFAIHVFSVNDWLSHCDACFHVVSEPLTLISTQLRGSVQQAKGVYIDGKGAAITTSMKVWHLNRRDFLPGQAGQGMFTHRLRELLLRLLSRFSHCGPNLPNPTIQDWSSKAAVSDYRDLSFIFQCCAVVFEFEHIQIHLHSHIIQANCLAMTWLDSPHNGFSSEFILENPNMFQQSLDVTCWQY